MAGLSAGFGSKTTNAAYTPSYTGNYTGSYAANYSTLGGTSTPKPSTPVLPVPSPGNTTPVMPAPGSSTPQVRAYSNSLQVGTKSALPRYGSSPQPAAQQYPPEAQPIYVPPPQQTAYRPPPTSAPPVPSPQPSAKQQATVDYEKQFKSAISGLQSTQTQNAAAQRAWLEAQAKKESEELAAQTQAVVNAPAAAPAAAAPQEESREIGAGWMTDPLGAGALSEGIGRRRMNPPMQPPLSGKVY